MSQLPTTLNKESVCIAFVLMLLLFACLTPAFSQKVGVNTETPQAGFHIISNDGLLIQGEIGQGTPPVTGQGLRMLFNTKTGAFRSGRISDAENGLFETWWNLGEVGDYSFASGLNLKASGFVSASFGNQNQATGLGTFVAGGLNNIASGDYSIAGGVGNSAPSYSEMVFGTFATDYIPGGIEGISSTDRLFVIGNGANESSRSNALTILKNGNTGIGTSSPSDKLHVVGNLRVDAGRISIVNTGQSVFVGSQAGLNDNLSDNKNVMIGYHAGAGNADGSNNIAIGSEAMANGSNYYYNIGIGSNVMSSSILSGGYNTGIGNFALQNITSGANNLAMGQNALGAATGATQNIAIGNYAGDAILSGTSNVAIGVEALGSATSGSNNTVIGYEAGRNTTGNSNIFLGYNAGRNETGSNKLYIENSNSSNPLIHGDFSTNKVTINDSLQTKYLKMTFGSGAGKTLKSDANGNGTWIAPNLLFEDTLNINLFLGSGVGGSVTTATNNTIMGAYAGEELTSGYENTGYGQWALQNSTDTYGNTAIGHNTLRTNVNGDNNTALGWSALSGIEGFDNTALGASAGGNNTTGSDNVFIGKESGSNNDGSGNIFIGNESGKNTTGSNQLMIDNSSTSTPLIKGDFSANEVTINDSLTVNKELGVGTSIAYSTLDVNGSVGAKMKSNVGIGGNQPDGTGLVYRYTGGTATITLPGASTCPNRMYVIINQTGATRNISTYRDLTTTNQTTIGSSVALWLMSDGAEWWQIK